MVAAVLVIDFGTGHRDKWRAKPSRQIERCPDYFSREHAAGEDRIFAFD